MTKIILSGVIIFATVFLISFSQIAIAQDGTYDATVTTESGSYTVPVEVEGDEVTQIHWPNGGDMNVEGARLNGGNEASGSNLRGDPVDVEIDDPSYNSEDNDDSDNGDE